MAEQSSGIADEDCGEEEECSPPISLLNGIADFLGLAAEPRFTLIKQLDAVGRQYLGDRSIETFWGTPGEQRDAIKAFIRSDLDTDLYDFVLPEYAVTIEEMAGRFRDAYVSRHQPAEVPSIKTFLRPAATLFEQRYRPLKGRPMDLPLELAVRALMRHFEETGGRECKLVISQNKNKPDSVKLISPEARAIGMLLRGVDRRLSERIVVNMIAKIRRQPRESRSQQLAILEADPAAALDCCLHPDRQAAIERIYLAAL